MENKNIVKTLKEIILNNIEEDLFVPVEDIKINDDLAAIGIDSLNIIKVIIEIELEFDIEFEDLDLKPENIGSLKALERYILCKLDADVA